WLAIYDRGLTAQEIRDDYRSLEQGPRGPRVLGRTGLLAFYAFDEGQGTRVRNHVASRPVLDMPATFFALEKRALTPPWEEFRRGEFSVIDAAVNVLGFVPVGLFFTLWAVRNLGLRARSASAIAVVNGLALSVLVELVQVEMPARTSSATDVITNIVGAVMGAALARWYLRTRGARAGILHGQ